MCRLFAFRSVLSSQVHSSLVGADNALGQLSQAHPDGWGVAYYVDQYPHLIKSTSCALEDSLFHKISAVVSSHTVLAHIRKATQGSHSILNSHPFHFGQWVFVHNGNISNFELVKDKLLKLLPREKQKYILGETDSELFFHILIDRIGSDESLRTYEYIHRVVKETIQDITHIIGSMSNRIKPKDNETYLSFVLTNGQEMLAFQGGQPVNYSTYKTNCPDSEHCSFFDKSCLNKADNNTKVNHLLIASEKQQGDNIWKDLQFGELIFLDRRMYFFKGKIF